MEATSRTECASHWPKMVCLPLSVGNGLFGDEELAAVGAAAGGARTGVGHGKEAGLVEGEGGVDLILEEVAGIAGAVAERSPPWIMKPGMTRWKVVPL